MASGVDHPGIQLAQTRFRLRLLDAWGIAPGATVLEIGCGQGDMTAVLADAVGEHGRVVAVDIAGEEYGAPVTLGESAAFLRTTPLGERIDMRFGFDVLDEANTFPDDTFDHVVLTHCSWYFASQEQIRQTLSRVRPWARRLCISEWELRPVTIGQLPHLLAVLIQGTVETSGAHGSGNVRTPFGSDTMLRILAASGWRPTAQRQVDTSSLQDADWEITASLNMIENDPRYAALSDALRDFVTAQADVLRSIARDRGNEPLPTYAITAEHA